MLKEKYEVPEMEIIILEHEDVIVTSGGDPWNDPWELPGV